MASKSGSRNSEKLLDDVDSLHANTDADSDSPDENDIIVKGLGSNSDDWAAINKRLRGNGLPIVKIFHPADIDHMTGSMICLDQHGSKTMRENLASLLSDSTHKQTLVQDLITRNNKLKEELARQTELTEKYFSKMKDLKIMLESSRARVKELESEGFSEKKDDWDINEKVNNTRTAVIAKNKDLEYKCKQYEKEIERLKDKVHNLAAQEDKRSKRVGDVFQEFRRRISRAHNSMDDKLLDVIDAYEKQIQTLQRDLDTYRSGGDVTRTDESEEEGEQSSYYSVSREQGPSGNFKKLVREYEKQIKELNSKLKKMEEEKELVKLDVGARPEVKDYRVAQLRMKKLEKLLALHNISIPGEKLKTDPYRLKRKFSTRVEDLEYLPLDLCHQYLKDISTELSVKDLETIVPRLQRMTKEFEEVHKYEQFSRTVQEIVNSLSEHKHKEKPGGLKKSDLSTNTLNHLVTVVENWKNDEEDLQELQLSINRLGERVAPWLKIHMTGEPSIAKVTAAVDRMVYDEGIEEKNWKSSNMRDIVVGHEHPNRAVLENIVSHFQTLFDVPSIAGVYPRMNQIFSKLGEVHNVLITLRNLLGLEKDAKSSAIVDSVGKLVQQHNSTTVQQLKTLLQTEDLEGVIRRLKEHQEFFPAFFEVTNKLFEILDVRRMDQIIPAVRALKLLAS